MATRKKSESAGEPAEEPGFDARLEALEAIVTELESGDLGLEPAIDRYQAGVELLQRCQHLLQSYRKRVEELSAGAEAALRPYAGDPDADDGD